MPDLILRNMSGSSVAFGLRRPHPLMQSYPTRALDRRLQEDWARDAREGPRILMNLRVDFLAHGPRLGPIMFVHIRLGCHYICSLYLGLHNVGRVPYKYRIFQPLYFWAPRLVFVLGVVL